MGVTYKLKDEVVQFIISQRQGNPLSSCRQLAESASREFQLHLSKSSVHDVLKEYGISTPRGRKPKEKFEIPQEKKKQIQTSLSEIKMIPDLVGPKDSPPEPVTILPDPPVPLVPSPEHEGAGRIFLKAVLWDLGIFPEQSNVSFSVLQDTDWKYYLTYSKGINVVLENSKSVFIDFPVPLERCVRETVDGLINNVKPFIVHKVSDEELFKASMEAQPGFKIDNISIVDCSDHILLKLSNIVELNRKYMLINRIYVESYENNILERAKRLFFAQTIDNNSFTENILNLKGFESTNQDENTVTLLIENNCEYKSMVQEAIGKLNGMYLRDEENRLVSVNIAA